MKPAKISVREADGHPGEFLQILGKLCVIGRGEEKSSAGAMEANREPDRPLCCNVDGVGVERLNRPGDMAHGRNREANFRVERRGRPRKREG